MHFNPVKNDVSDISDNDYQYIILDMSCNSSCLRVSELEPLIYHGIPILVSLRVLLSSNSISEVLTSVYN